MTGETTSRPVPGSRVPDSEGAVAIDAKGLSLWYGAHQALFEIGVSFQKERITAIIGPSGCGKSTLLRCLNRMNDLYPPIRDAGSIHFHEQDIIGPGIDLVDLRRRVGMVFLRATPFPMSIFDNVAYGPRLQGIRAKGRLESIVESAL